MDKARETNRNVTDLVPVQPAGQVTVLPPNSGVVGRFLKHTEDMFKARAMRMSGLLRRINESGQRTESLLRTAAERMEAAETALEQQFQKEGLLVESQGNTDTEIGQT
ncbi:MAG: hypothetical protein ACLP5H_25455 [Desulfomonilaceae bacterium]